MWEEPSALWRRLKLGREEYLQRLLTTLIVGGDPPPWNTPRTPTARGLRFLQRLHELAHPGDDELGPPTDDVEFVDECLLPKMSDDGDNGWPDWVVRWPGRVWIVELKTERRSHRPAQLPLYLLLVAAAHPDASIDLTYLTGALDKPAPDLGDRQRYAHVTWDDVLPLVEDVWAQDVDAAPYLATVQDVVHHLSNRSPTQQRDAVIGAHARQDADLLALARATAEDGQQRAVGAGSAADLEALRDAARTEIDALPADDAARFVLPWLWQATRTDGSALTAEGAEFGYELRFSRYKTVQIGS